jgi:hypothetical protein
MSGFELVAGVIGLFFVVGIVVGVLIVIVLPPIRDYSRLRRNMNGGAWQRPPARGDNSQSPHWPDRSG